MGFATGAFAGYRVGAELGRGGMGVVLSATHVASGRPVALKLMLAARDPEARARFAREVQALTAVRHPGIVTLLDAGEHEGTPFLAMERLDGGSLRELLRAGPLDPARAASLVAEVARAVHAAHEAELVHRDLKPANILFDRAGRPKVADFGLVRMLFGAERLTQTGTVLGTPHYLAPEQLGAAPRVDRRADVYALGAILFEALTGEPPYAQLLPPTLWDRILHGAVPSARERRRGVSPALDALCRRALAKDPGARPSTALDLALELERALARPRRGRRVVVLAAVLAAALGGALALGLAPTAPELVMSSSGPRPGTGGLAELAAPTSSEVPDATRADLEAPDTPDEEAFASLLRAGRHDEALALAEAATTPRVAATRRARALLERGLAKGQGGDRDARLADLHAAVDALRDVDGPSVSLLRGRLFEELEQWELAASAQVDALGHGDVSGAEREGLLERALHNALRAYPDEARTSFFTDPRRGAVALTAADGVLRAVADRAEGTRLAGRANVALARALHTRGAEPAAVREALTGATSQAPSEPEGWWARAEWHAARGDAEAAHLDLRRARALTADARDAVRDALSTFVEARRMLERGEHDGALTALAIAWNLVPEHPIADAAARLHVDLTGRPPLSPWAAPPGDSPPAATVSFFAPPQRMVGPAESLAPLRNLVRAAAGTETGVALAVTLARTLHARGAPLDQVRAALEAAAGTDHPLGLLARAEWHAARGEVAAARADLDRAGPERHPTLSAWIEGVEAADAGDLQRARAALLRASAGVGPYPTDAHMTIAAKGLLAAVERRLAARTGSPEPPPAVGTDQRAADAARQALERLQDARDAEERSRLLGLALRQALQAHPAASAYFFDPGARAADPAVEDLFERIAREGEGTLAEPLARVALARVRHASGAARDVVKATLDAAVDAVGQRRSAAAHLARAEWSAARHDEARARADLEVIRAAASTLGPGARDWFERLDAYVSAREAHEGGRTDDAVSGYKRVYDLLDVERRAGRPFDTAMMWRAAEAYAALRGEPAPIAASSRPPPPADPGLREALATLEATAADDVERTRRVLDALQVALRVHPAGRTSFFAPSAAVSAGAEADATLRWIAEQALGTQVAGAAWVVVARALHARGASADEVRAALDAAIAVVPDHHAVHLARAEWLAARGDHAAARSDLDAARARWPSGEAGEAEPMRPEWLGGFIDAAAAAARGDMAAAAAGYDEVARAAAEEHPPLSRAARTLAALTRPRR